MWFSNRRAKWRREEKLRNQRRGPDQQSSSQQSDPVNSQQESQQHQQQQPQQQQISVVEPPPASPRGISHSASYSSGIYSSLASSMMTDTYMYVTKVHSVNFESITLIILIFQQFGIQRNELHVWI